MYFTVTHLAVDIFKKWELLFHKTSYNWFYSTVPKCTRTHEHYGFYSTYAMSVNDIWLIHQCSMNWILNIKLKLWWLKSHHIGWGGLLYLLYTISYTYQGSGSIRNMLQCLLVPNVIALLLLFLFYTVWSEPLSKQYTCKKRNTHKLLEPVPVFDQ